MAQNQVSSKTIQQAIDEYLFQAFEARRKELSEMVDKGDSMAAKLLEMTKLQTCAHLEEFGNLTVRDIGRRTGRLGKTFFVIDMVEGVVVGFHPQGQYGPFVCEFK